MEVSKPGSPPREPHNPNSSGMNFPVQSFVPGNPESVHAALHLAAMHGDKFSIRALSLLKHDINQSDNEATTPMHHAAVNSHMEAVKWLAPEAKADVKPKGKTALDLTSKSDVLMITSIVQPSTTLFKCLNFFIQALIPNISSEPG